MKILFPIFISFLAMFSVQVVAETCKDTKLIIQPTKTLPRKDLKLNKFQNTNLWFTQESHLQEPEKLVWDTLITVSDSKGSLLQILAEGHTREFAVETKWRDHHTLRVNVEWGHALFCSYKVDIETKTSSF